MDLANARSAVRRDKPVFLLHIPKTGGNTVIAQFLSFLPVETVWPPPPGLVLDAAALADAGRRLQTLRFVHGHVDENICRHIPLEDVRLVTFIRHPVRLAVSHYLYLREQPANRLHAAAMALPIDAFYRQFRGMMVEPQASYFTRALGFPSRPGAPLGADGLAFALRMLDRCAFIGVTERMQASVDGMSEALGLPPFPVGRQNASGASREEAERCAATLMTDEFLMMLGGDFALRRAAESWFSRRQREARRAVLAARLADALAGAAAMPEVVAEGPGLALAFLDGWLPQGWSGEPCSSRRYWWTRRGAALMLAAREAGPCSLRLRVVNTMGFDAAAITATALGRPLAVTPRAAEDAPGVMLEIALPGEVMAGGSVVLELEAPLALPFSDFDASIADHEPRGFAVRDFVIERTAG